MQILHLTLWIWLTQGRGVNTQISGLENGTDSITPPPAPIPKDYKKKPPKEDWVQEGQRENLVKWLIDGCWMDETCSDFSTKPIEYEGYDGFYNNLAHPELGAVDTPLLRRVPAAYEDGVYKPAGGKRENPLTLSEKLMKNKIGTQSRTGKTALLVFFGQQVVEEILDAQRPACPPEYINIKVPEGHEYNNIHSEMPVLRTRFDMRTGHSPNNPRQQLNEITPWLDGGLTYGTTKTWSDQLRKGDDGKIVKDGLLASSEGGLFPALNKARLPMANPPPPFYHGTYIKQHATDNVNRFFKLGNPRGNENPFLLTFGILWFRWHNVLATYLRKAYPLWNDEKVYNEARKWVIASHQHIVINTWLPIWLGKELPKYEGYDPSIDPQIDQFFQSAAFRFGHTLVPPGVYLRDYGRNGCKTITYPHQKFQSVRTCQHYWRPQESIQEKLSDVDIVDIDRLLMGMASQLCEAEDHKIVEDLRGRVFGPLEFSRRDLMALNIQRARDHGLPDYNTAREAFNLPRISVHEVNSHFKYVDNTTLQIFLKLYNYSMDDVDVWVGGLLETGNTPGELFTKIIMDQFRRIRDGDRFWYKNNNGLFTKEQIRRLEQLTLYDIIMSVTKMDHSDIQINPFQAATSEDKLNKNCSSLKEHSCINTTTTKAYKCYHLPALDENNVESCSSFGKYDYFSASKFSFIGTYVFVSIAILAIMGFMWLLAHLKQKKNVQKIQRIAGIVRQSYKKEQYNFIPYSVYEWVDNKTPPHSVVVLMDSNKKQVQVRNQLGKLQRAMDLTHANIIHVFIVTDGLHLMLRVSNDYDLVIKFDSDYLRENFLQGLEKFVTEVGIARERVNITLHPALRQAVTKQDRQKRLEMFFRVVFSQAFNITHSEEEILKIDSRAAREVIYTELTINEFAEALSMRAESEFVRKMFALVDKDKNGFVSFREFVDMLIIFAKGSADDKVKLMFDMYDINGTGNLTREDFRNMIKSLMETVNADVEQRDLDNVINSMMLKAGLTNKEAMGLEDFQHLLLDYKDKLGYTQLNFPGIQAPQNLPTSSRPSFIDNARETAFSLYSGPQEMRNEHRRLQEEMSIDGDQEIQLTSKEKVHRKPSFQLALTRIIDNYARQIFWVTLYTIIMLAIFAERAYYYSVEREHTGLRRIAGYGVTITRGAASAMMFTYSSLLVTMCRNTITILRDTFLHVYFPFDWSVSMHKYIACWALLFTVMHTVGHAFNFYSISTQTADDLTCLFRNYHHALHELPKFHYWCWQTITGVTGIMLTLLTALIYIFALPIARTRLYNGFWFTHSLYPFFYILMLLHGAGRLIQEPFLHYFLLGPVILFAIDRLITVTRKKVEIPVVNAELLPSNVTLLEIKKPHNFEYKSGQWVRIACPALNTSEYHPFTISSAPHESNVTVHIRAVGPWTTNIRNLYDPNVLREKALPKIHLEGPYGEGHQDWYQFDVAVLIGGGIGVTPFASILKDIVFRANIKQHAGCKKVYFLWVTKTQKQFEWLVDIIRDVETADERGVVSVHIFITQFYQKFDLRTILLYICERHFQRVSNRSLFTGLKAVTHFGRPHFLQFFKSLQTVNPKVRKVGVFSCGPPPMTQTVDQACIQLNKETATGPIFQHHFKNF